MMSISELTPALGTPALLPLACRIPQPHDHEDFMRLCDVEERARLRELSTAFAEIERARTIKEGAAYAAGRRRHLGRGWEAKTLANLHRLWTNGGHKIGDFKKDGPRFPKHDFRALMRSYQAGKDGLPEDFIAKLAEVFAQFRGRSDAVQAWYRHFIHEVWLGNEPVPGYGRASDWYADHARLMPHGLLIRSGDLPAGWSLENLRRHLPKRKAIRAQLAHGYLAAHSHLPDQVLGDRSQLRPFERIFLDDVRPDLRCLWLNQGAGEIVYPLMVLGLDAASGVDVANVAKPRALKEDGTREGITRDMTLQVVVNTLQRWGLPPWPITFVVENAAACLTSEDRALIADMFGDRIQFEETAIFRERMTTHGFTQGGGCPWDKAAIESFFRVLQTQLAAMRGSTGPRYDQMHGEIAAIEKYCLAIVNAAEGVESVLSQLRTPLPRFDSAHEAIERALRLLRFRTNHGLQGFERIVEAQLQDGAWVDEAALAVLPEDRQEGLRIVNRLECPAERFTRLLQGHKFEQVDPDLLTWLRGPRFKVTVRAGKIAHKAAAIANEPLIFREPGHTLLDDDCEGRTYDAAMAPDASRLVLAEDGRLVGAVERQGRVDQADRAAVHREQGRVRAARQDERVRLAGYLANQDTYDQTLREHNDAVLAAAPAIAAAAAQARIEPEAPKATVAERQANRRRAAALADLARRTSDPSFSP